MEAHLLRVVGGADPPAPCEQFDRVLPTALLVSNDLSGTAKLVAAMLWAMTEWHEDTIIATRYTALAEAVGVTERALRDVIKDLQRAGFLTVIQGRQGRGGGCELRVLGLAKLVERFKLRQGTDAQQRSFWPLDGLISGPGDAGQLGAESTENSELGGPEPPKLGVLRTENSELIATRAPARALNSNTNTNTTSRPLGLEGNSKAKANSNSNSTSVSNSSLSAIGAPTEGAGAAAGERIEQMRDWCRATSKTITHRYGRPNTIQQKFFVLGALLRYGEPVRVWCGGGRHLLAKLSAHDVDSVVTAALRREAEFVGKSYYCILRDRIRRATSTDARMPSTVEIREACERIGWAWSEKWERSPEDLERQAREEAST